MDKSHDYLCRSWHLWKSEFSNVYISLIHFHMFICFNPCVASIAVNQPTWGWRHWGDQQFIWDWRRRRRTRTKSFCKDTMLCISSRVQYNVYVYIHSIQVHASNFLINVYIYSKIECQFIVYTCIHGIVLLICNCRMRIIGYLFSWCLASLLPSFFAKYSSAQSSYQGLDTAALHSPSQANERGIRYPTHLLLYPAWYGDGWYDSDVQCTAQQKASVLPYSLGVQISEFIANYSTVAEGGIVSINCVPALCASCCLEVSPS